jgi:transcription termination/antitermination protein NusG
MQRVDFDLTARARNVNIVQSEPAGELSWYAITTRSRQEKVSSLTLESLGIPHFLPLIEEQRQWTDRKKVVTIPLFPGYLFIQSGIVSRIQLDVCKIRGVIGFVGDSRGPKPIPDQDIDNVRSLISQGKGCLPHPAIPVGDRVRIARGPLSGIEGTLVRYGVRSRVVISIEAIQRAVSVEVALSEIESAPAESDGLDCAGLAS